MSPQVSGELGPVGAEERIEGSAPDLHGTTRSTFARPQAYAETRDYNQLVDLVFVLGEDVGQRCVAGPLSYGKDIADATIDQPTVTLSRKAALALVESLWSQGIRPQAARRELDVLRDAVTAAKATFDALTKRLT